jgi:hypothetical protein
MRRLLVIANVVPNSPIITLVMEAPSSPKRRFLQEPQGITSQKTTFFTVAAMKTSNLTSGLLLISKSGRGCGLHFWCPWWAEWIDGCCLGSAGSLWVCQDHAYRWRRCRLCSGSSIRVLGGQFKHHLLIVLCAEVSYNQRKRWAHGRTISLFVEPSIEGKVGSGQEMVFLRVTDVKTSNLTKQIKLH